MVGLGFVGFSSDRPGFCSLCYHPKAVILHYNRSSDVILPIILSFDFSRNNGYAISTPTEDQYKGDGIGNADLSYLCSESLQLESVRGRF